MEQKIIPIKIQVDNTEAEKAYQDLEKASQKMANNVSKNSKKANDNMVKDTQSATSKLTKCFKDVQKQMNKSIDVSKIGKQLSSLRSQIQSSLGNIVINAQANITTKEQGVNKPSSQSQVNTGLSGAIASGAILNNQLSQMHDKLENISKVEVAEVFKDTAPEVQDVVKGMELIKEALHDIELGEGVELSEFAKSVEAQLNSVRKAFETLITDKTKVSMADLKRELRDLEQTLFGLGVESEAVAKLTNELAKMSKARGLTKIGDMATDEEISSMKKAIGIAEELVSTATKGIDRVELFDNIEEDIAKLTALQSKLEETKKKADAIALGSATESFLNKISKTGYEVDNLNDLLATQNEIINSNTRLTNAQRDAMLQYSSSTIAGIKQIVAGQQAQVTSTNAVAQSQSKLATTMGKLKSSYQTVKDSLSQFKAKNDEWLKNHVKTTEGIKKANKGLELSFKSLLKAIVPFLSIGAIFTGLKTSINNAMDSIETASKFESIFGSEAQEMSKWINQLNKELGVNVTSMMDYTSTLYGMGINLGFTTDKAVQFSKDLGMLSQDMASFYNISSDDAFNKLRSYMAGSTEVLYDFGVVATEANLQTFALSQGITKAYSSMSQAEKSMLRYQFAMKGLSQANKDLENTLPSPANQARVLKESLNQLSVALGKCFIPILTVVLPILNTFTQALTRTINAVATFISSLFEVFGVKTNFGGSDGVVGAVNDMASSIEGADIGSGGLADNLGSGASSAKEIAKFLGGIDELNIVTTKQDSGSGGGSGSGGSGGAGGITGGNIDTGAIDKGLAQVETKLQQWAEKVGNTLKKGWNSVGDYISTSANKLKQSFAHLGQSIESFLIGCWNNGGEELIYNIGRLAGAFTGLAIDVSGQVVDAVAKLFDHLNPDSNPYTRKFIEAMNEALVACQNFALSAGAWLSTFMSSGGQAFLNVMGDIVMLLGTTLVNAFANCINWITAFMNSWAGQTILKVVAVSLDVLAGALKLVMIAVEKLTPVWSGLLMLMGAKATFDMIQKALALTTKKLVDFGLKVASNIESLVVWTKGVIKLATAFTKNLVKGLASATKGAVSFGVAMLKNAGKALASGIASISAYIAGLIGLDGALVASTFAAGGLKIALDLLGIGLIVTAVIALVTAVIKIGNKFNWWSNIANWLGEKLGWVWDKVKNFFGWTGDNNVSEEFDDTTDSIEGMGDAFEETTDEIETTSDRFGTIASKVNQHFASIGFDAGKLANDLSEAEAMMNEKFGMMSKNAQEYLDALATGNQEVLTQMSADSETYTQEILYSYQKLSENEKNTFYETYGYIKGINDDWLNYSGLTYEQLMAKHASYSANIMKDEDLTAQEKDKLIDEHLTKVNLAYEEELTALKKQKKEILNNSKLSDEERQRLLEDVNAKIIAKEQEKTGKVIDEIESVTDAQEKSSKAQQESVEEATDAQVKALKDVDKSLNDTKKTLSSFKSESDKIANSIPKAWSGVGKKISKEFSDAKTSITNSMSSLLTTVQANVNKIKNSMSGMTTGISTDFNKSLNTLSNNIDAKFKSMVSNIQSFAKQMRNAMNFNFPTPYLKMPHLSVTGKWDFEKQQVPKFKVNWYSSGGIFPTRTLIGVGDANKGVGNNAEAVLPLDVLWDKLDRKFANQNKQLISALSNTDQPVILQLNLDGEVLAKKQFKTYKDLTRRRVVDFTELV